MTALTPTADRRRAVTRVEHREATRTALLASARRLFAERGFHDVTAEQIATDAGVTERTLFRYFPTKVALVLDEVLVLMPEMFGLIRDRPARERPYTAMREGILAFGSRHRDLLVLLVGPPKALHVSIDSRQRTLVDYEEMLADVLAARYSLQGEDRLRAAVWARAGIGALRSALISAAAAATRTREPYRPVRSKTPISDAVCAAFAALDGRA